MPTSNRGRRASTTTPARPTSKIETITPAYAQEVLDTRNTVNRRYEPRRAAVLARDITSGTFRLNGETVKFDLNDQLKDGQHRLGAIVLAGVPVEIMVVRGLQPEVMNTIDIGSKRTMGQILAINGFTDANLMAASGSQLWRYLGGKLPRLGPDQDPTHEELLTFVDERQIELIEAMSIGRRTIRHVRVHASVMSTAYAIMHEIDPEACVEFFEKLGTGADLETGNPILALRNRFARDGVATRNKMSQSESLACTIKAWNDWRDGRTRNTITWYFKREAFPQAA